MSIAEKVLRAKADIDAVYEAGKAQGGDSYYDTFWDNYQNYGNRTDYELAFAGKGWTEESFKPKYDITATSDYASQMFWGCNITDLSGILKKQNVELITEGCKNPLQMFQNSKIEIIPPLDFSSATGSTSYCFASNRIKTIERLKVSENTRFVSQTFSNASALENITFEGVIGNDISFSSCSKLTHDSLMSIIGALKPFVTYEEVITEYPDERWYNSEFDDEGYYDKWWEIERIWVYGEGDDSKVVFDVDGLQILTNIKATSVDDLPDYLKNATHFKAYKGGTGFDIKFIKAISTGETRTLTLGSANLEKLTDGEKAIATQKGWTLA